MPKRVLIWGIGKDFWDNYNLIHLHQEMGNIDIIGYIDAKNEGTVDGCNIINPEVLLKSLIEFDYIIITTTAYWREIVNMCLNKLNIRREKILFLSVFKLPYFNWQKYLKLIKNPPSVIAEQCIGGYLLHDMRLPFNSPFINTLVGHVYKNDVWDLFENIDTYMKIMPNKMPIDSKYSNGEANLINERIEYPRLWYDNICLHGFHYRSQEVFFENWEKRRRRFDANNKLYIKVIYNTDDLERFEALDVKKKMGIYYKKCSIGNVYSLCDFEDIQGDTYKWGEYIRSNRNKLYQQIDLFSKFMDEN